MLTKGLQLESQDLSDAGHTAHLCNKDHQNAICFLTRTIWTMRKLMNSVPARDRKFQFLKQRVGVHQSRRDGSFFGFAPPEGEINASRKRRGQDIHTIPNSQAGFFV